MSIIDALSSELRLLVRWVSMQIERNARGESALEPLFQESRDLLEARGVWVGWDHDSKKVRVHAVLARSDGSHGAEDE